MQVLSSLQIAYMDMVGFVIEATPGTDGTVDATSRGTITRLPFTVSLKKKCGSYNFVEKLYNIRKWQPLLAVSFKSSLFSKMNWQPRSWPGTAQINCIFVFFKNPTLEFTALETEELLRLHQPYCRWVYFHHKNGLIFNTYKIESLPVFGVQSLFCSGPTFDAFGSSPRRPLFRTLKKKWKNKIWPKRREFSTDFFPSFFSQSQIVPGKMNRVWYDNF